MTNAITLDQEDTETLKQLLQGLNRFDRENFNPILDALRATQGVVPLRVALNKAWKLQQKFGWQLS